MNTAEYLRVTMVDVFAQRELVGNVADQNAVTILYNELVDITEVDDSERRHTVADTAWDDFVNSASQELVEILSVPMDRLISHLNFVVAYGETD